MNDINLKLEYLLKTKGVCSSQEITDALKISRATLSRLLQNTKLKISKVGNTKNLKYGLQKQDKISVYEVDAIGIHKLLTSFEVLYKDYYILNKKIYSGLPPEIDTIIPQGFLGRSFAKHNSKDLSIPERLDDWSNDHIIQAITNRGEDVPSNLIFGKNSVDRYLNNTQQEHTLKDYKKLSDLALNNFYFGSSAGGERPKFLSLRNNTHYLVKFCSLSTNEIEVRLTDLLISESIALDTLNKHELKAAEASLHFIDDTCFLEIERFDRIKSKGRKTVLTLAAIDNFLYGDRTNYVTTAQKLVKDKILSKEDYINIKTIEAFSIMIADTDRHYYNLSFFSNFSFDNNKLDLRLAPVYDKLPMFFMPVANTLLNNDYIIPSLAPDLFDVLIKAKIMAKDFWETVCDHEKISKNFKVFASRVLKQL